jgi:thiazole synthase
MLLHIDGIPLTSRFFLGTALYPSLEIMRDSILTAKVQVITVSLRRQLEGAKNAFWDYIKNLNCRLLPNTAGCFSAKEAIYTANMAREVFATHWIKLEVIGDHQTLHPHPLELLKACDELIKQGYFVFAYCTEDLIVCEQLLSLGCQVLMPWAAPIGTGKGILNHYALRLLRERFKDSLLFIDAGIGSPAHAAAAMELGFDGVLLNSAVALAHDPVTMASAFRHAIIAGRMAYEAGIMPQRDFAMASTPLLGKPMLVT